MNALHKSYLLNLVLIGKNKKSHVEQSTWLLSCYPNFFQSLQRLPSSTAASGSTLGFTAFIILRRVYRPLTVTLS